MSDTYGITHSFVFRICPYCGLEDIITQDIRHYATRTRGIIRTRYFRCNVCKRNFKSIEIDQRAKEIQCGGSCDV
jgi:hypothetical protein